MHLNAIKVIKTTIISRHIFMVHDALERLWYIMLQNNLWYIMLQKNLWYSMLQNNLWYIMLQNNLLHMFQTRAQYLAVLLVFFIRNASVKPVNLPNDRLIGIFSFFGKFTSLNLKAE